jgi:hypothetical protein
MKRAGIGLQNIRPCLRPLRRFVHQDIQDYLVINDASVTGCWSAVDALRAIQALQRNKKRGVLIDLGEIREKARLAAADAA